MIEPTVGRIVYYYPGGTDRMMLAVPDDYQPLAAIITHVNNERSVNLTLFDLNGTVVPRRQIRLRQPEDPKVVSGSSGHCEWMPYQVGQAKKTEELQEKFDSFDNKKEPEESWMVGLQGAPAPDKEKNSGEKEE